MKGKGESGGGCFKTVIFIDNGNTGSMGWYGEAGAGFCMVPVKTRMSHHVKPHKIKAVDGPALSNLISDIIKQTGHGKKNVIVCRERPMINPKRWKASLSASRSDEAETIVLEAAGIPFIYVDSKTWQHGTLPSSGTKGVTSSTLKAESMAEGLRLFPEFSTLIKKHKDADGILGARVMYDILNRRNREEGGDDGGNGNGKP